MSVPASSPLRDYIEKFDDLPKDVLLGRVVLFTITDIPTSHQKLVDWFDELALDKRYLPAPNKAIDAFKKATSDTKGSYDVGNSRTAYLLCRDVSSSRDFVQRQITREIRDPGKRVLRYDEAITCTFFRATSSDQATARLRIQVQQQKLMPHELATVQHAAQEIKARYDTYYEYLDGQKVRYMVRAYLKHLNAIEVKGGVYFIHVSRDEELSRLATLVGRLGGGCYMQTIPIADLENQREFITAAFEREAAQSLDELIRDMKEQIKGKRRPSEVAYSKLKGRFDELVEHAEEHMIALRISQDNTAASAEVAMRILGDLQERVISDDD